MRLVFVGMTAVLLAAGNAACTESGRNFVGHTAPDGDTGEPDTGEDASVGDTTVAPDAAPSLGCAVVEELFTPYCTRCHNQNEIYPNLNAGGLKYLIDGPAIAYPGETLVVAGDLEASFLYRKVHGPTAAEGLKMPPDDGETPELTPEAIAALEDWIEGGAPLCEGHNDPGPMPPPIPVAGGELTFSTAPSGFQTTRPAWAEDGPCQAAQWWKYSGDTESDKMHPGQACIDCHTREREGPSYSFAGTVYPGIDEASDCRGVSGVLVEIIDENDAVIATATSNSAGNFFIRKSSAAFRPFRARLTYQEREREMTLIQSDSGDCNTCHDSSGQQGTLGRIVVP